MFDPVVPMSRPNGMAGLVRNKRLKVTMIYRMNMILDIGVNIIKTNGSNRLMPGYYPSSVSPIYDDDRFVNCTLVPFIILSC